MGLLDNRIVDFINAHHVLTLATCNDDEPWCANCFYIYLEEENMFVFTSDLDTKHILQTAHNVFVAGSIVLETSVIGKIQGVQFQGYISQLHNELLSKAKMQYLKRFPMAALMKTTLWGVDLTLVKFTDNRLGFGKKILWTNDDKK